MKSKKIGISLLLLIAFTTSYSQGKMITKSGTISFFSSTPVEDIKADNNQVLSIVDTSNGKVAIAVLMKSFLFEKSLMQEHFNENYVESDEFPKATFKGSITNLDAVLKGESKALLKGNLTMHGVTKPITVTSEYSTTKEGAVLLKGKFVVAPEAYKIKIPSVVKNNIAKTIEISFELNHKPYKAKR